MQPRGAVRLTLKNGNEIVFKNAVFRSDSIIEESASHRPSAASSEVAKVEVRRPDHLADVGAVALGLVGAFILSLFAFSSGP